MYATLPMSTLSIQQMKHKVKLNGAYMVEPPRLEMATAAASHDAGVDAT
jgi:hypothetical protein